MKLKKLLASILAVAMVLSTMSFSVFATDTDIIEVGTGETYETWSDAIAASADTDGDDTITYHIYGKVLMDSHNIKGSAATINIVGMTADAELSVETAHPKDNSIVYVNDSTIETVNFSNIKLSRPNGDWRDNEAHANRFFTVWDSDGSTDLITYTNCVFPNGSSNNQYGGTTEYTNCKFYNDVYYALWIYDDGKTTNGVTTNVSGCYFEADRGVKTYSENHYVGAAKATTNIANCEFKIASKPAVVSSLPGTITMTDVDADECPYGLLATEAKDGNASHVLANVTVDGETPAYVAKVGNMLCTDIDYANAETNATKPIEVPVAIVNGQKPYTSLQEAIDAVSTGDNTIKLLADVEGNVTFTQTEGVNIVLDGNNKDFDGTIYIHGNARYTGAETLTIQNVNFVTNEGKDFISSNTTASAERYAHNVTVKDCTFTSNTTEDVVGMRFRQAYNIDVVGCTFENMHSAMWATGVSNGLDFDGITTTNCQNGISVGTSKDVTVKNSQIEAVAEGGYGVRADGEDAYSLKVENCEIDAFAPVLVRKANKDASVDYSLTVTDSTLETSNPYGYEVVVTGADYDDPNTTIEEPKNINFTFDKPYTISSYEAYVDGKGYTTLEAAVAAAVEGDTIDLMGNVVDLPEINSLKITKDVTIENGTIDITNGTWNGNSIIEVSGGTAGDPVVATFNNVDFVGDNYSSAFGVIYAHSHGKVVINGCDFNLSNEKYSAGGVLKGNGVAASAFDVTNSTFDLENPNRIIANATVNLDGVTIKAEVTDDSLTVGVMNNHAFRNLVGTVKNSKISVDGFETGIKNTEGDLSVSNNSIITLTGSKDTDLVVGAGKKVSVDDTSKLYADSSNIADDAVVEGDGFISKADSIYVQYKKVNSAEGTAKYEIVLLGANAEKVNELASADLTFDFNGTPATNGAMDYTVAPAEGVSLTQLGDRFMFNYNGVDKYEESGAAIVIGTITIEGYGSYTLGTKDVITNAVYATEIRDNIVDGFTPAAGLVINKDMSADDDMFGVITNGNIAVPTRKLTVNIAFPNAIDAQDADYQDMKVEITGNIDGVNQTVTYDLGATMVNGAYVVTEDRLVLDNAYTVTVSGAGYRTARYTVTMTNDKELNFWNNVKDELTVVEIGKDSSAAKVTFLAGDIVKDNKINIYDLSAVVSYFGTENLSASHPEYVKYDLNRDGKIDSKDVAYVLVSWGN